MVHSFATEREVVHLFRESQSGPLSRQAVAGPDEDHMEDGARRNRASDDGRVRRYGDYSALEADSVRMTLSRARGKPHGISISTHAGDCERIAYRRGAILLILRECSGFNPRRCRH